MKRLDEYIIIQIIDLIEILVDKYSSLHKFCLLLKTHLAKSETIMQWRSSLLISVFSPRQFFAKQYTYTLSKTSYM